MKKIVKLTLTIIWFIIFFCPMLITLVLTWPDNSPTMSILASLGSEFIAFIAIGIIGAVINRNQRRKHGVPGLD
ncbi:MAG: hypothetical protein E7082_07340 [Bacteroidales bacterium]|nr:hypothetical protein [Bacteroidales bacterium]